MNFKLTSVLLASCCLLTACVGGLQTAKVSVNIGFRPVIGNDTRAEESVPFPTDKSFILWAQEQNSDNLYIDKTTVAYDNGWTVDKLWGDNPLRFSACWPTDLDYVHSKADGVQIHGFELADGDIDIIVAETTADNKSNALVTLNFQHVLSRVEFRVNHYLTDNMSIRINKIELKNIAKKGSYNTTAKNDWSGLSEYGSHVVFDHPEGQMISSQTLNYVGEELYAIPQLTVGVLEMQCEVRYGSGGWVPQKYVIDPFEIIWDPGKHYTYSITFRMDQVVYTAGISSWGNR